MNKLSIIFSMASVQLNDTEQQALHALFAEWVVLHEAGARLLIDALINSDTLSAAQTALAAYNPNIIGQWDAAGTLLSPFDSADYIALSPPLLSLDETQNIIATPRTTAVEIHRFGGWPPRSFA